MAIGTELRISFDARKVQRGLAALKTSIGNISSAGLGITKLGTGLAALGVAGAAAVAGIAVKLNEIGEAALAADNRLKNITKSMGLFGNRSDEVTGRLLDFADAQERATGTDAIVQTQAKLMTFKELAASADQMGGAFDRATMAAVDLAAAGFGSAESNATALGKALQDPVRGIAALTRNGITFTAEEKKKIAALVEANKTYQAQDMILKAIETQVGGTAAATATASGKIKASMTQVVEAFAIPFSQGFAGLPSALESTFPALIEKATQIGDLVSSAIADSINGNQDKFVAIGDLIGNTIAAAATATFQGAATGIVTKWKGGVGEVHRNVWTPGGAVLNQLAGMLPEPPSYGELLQSQMINRGIRQQGADLLNSRESAVRDTRPGYTPPPGGAPFSREFQGQVIESIRRVEQNTAGGAKM